MAVEVDQPPYAYQEPPPGEVEQRIGGHVAELIVDGATLQLGIGAIPSATALALRDKRDLGIHTEMFTDAVIGLVECGAVTGARKEINRGKIVSAFLMGVALYRFVHDGDGRAAAGRLHQRYRGHSRFSDGRHQLGYRSGSRGGGRLIGSAYSGVGGR
jgi:hypothetical protein